MSKGKEKIIESAISLFAKTPYEAVSVSNICKDAKVSNGLFYKFFKDKETIFRFLLEETSIRIDRYFQEVKGDSVEEKFKSFIDINFLLTKKEFNLIKVYREGQYKFIEYEKILKDVYWNTLESIFDKKIDKYDYLFLMSGIRYINVNFIARGIENNSNFLAKIILNGFLKEHKNLDVKELKESKLYLRVPFHNENMKNLLLTEGEKLFGNKGVYKTKITDIVKATGEGFGVGTFYYYYKTKELFLKEIGENIKDTFIFFLKDNLNPNIYTSTIDKLVLFLYLTLEYFQNSTYKYGIIRELEFIDPDFHKNMASELEKFLISNLDVKGYTYEEKVIISAVFSGISHYMGIEFFFTKEFEDKELFLEKVKNFMIHGYCYY